MHPILFRIPLPNKPLKWWWLLAAGIAIALVYVVMGARKKDRNAMASAGVVAFALAVGAYVVREKTFQSANLPIYSYGVMLGLSLVVGWFFTLHLAGKYGLPKETIANCYVFAAVCAIAGSRLLYIATNPDDFKEFADIFALRRGGLVAYGGFLGGYLGAWGFLRHYKLRVMPLADAAAPSLASGLLITRIGCYLFGCDFGKRLTEASPSFLKKLGTFPHWAQGTVENGDGSPAFVRHLELFRGTPLGADVMKANASLPVHPTQLYEALCGLFLLVILLWQRKNQRFRGQVFLLFVFGYGFLRFLLEQVRDDTERGSIGPTMPEHVYLPFCLLLLGGAFVYGISLGIESVKVRNVARVLALVLPIAAYVVLRPVSFGTSVPLQLSTSQVVGIVTGVLAGVYYAKFWTDAVKNPRGAMTLATLGEGIVELSPEAKAEYEAEKKKAEKGKKKKAVAGSKAAAAKVEAKAEAVDVAKDEAESHDEDEDDEDDELEDGEAVPDEPEAASPKAKASVDGDKPKSDDDEDDAVDGEPSPGKA